MKISFVILLHLGYWIMYLLLLAMIMVMLTADAVKTGPSKQEIIVTFLKVMTAITILPGIISFYSFYHYIFNYLARKKIAKAVLYGIAITIGCGTIGFIGLNLLNNGLLFRHNGIWEILLMIAFMGLLSMVHGIIAVVIKGFINWYGDIKVKEELQQKNFETELALVKLQLNPHFLFNTINNIDVLIEKDAVKASAYLNKLSDIMRFMLYETKTENIPLEKELTYISKYIDLQKIRNSNSEFVQLDINGDARHLMIAPMLFVPFIENAFKHAANKKKQQAIIIRIDITRDSIYFFCKNDATDNPLNKDEPGGLGNELIAKRLDLLYPGKHLLDISRTEDDYTVALTIQTNRQHTS